MLFIYFKSFFTTGSLIGIGILAGINAITGLKRQNRINRIEEDLENEQSSMESLESKVSSLETSCSPGGMSGENCKPFILIMIKLHNQYKFCISWHGNISQLN